MAEYKIILDAMSGFGAEVTSANQHQFVRVFPTETDAQTWIAEHQAAAETTIPEIGISTPGSENMRYRLYLLGKSGDVRAAEAFLAEDDVRANGIALSVFSACCDDFEGYEVWNGAMMISRGPGPRQSSNSWAITQASQRDVLDLEDRMQRVFACVRESRKLLDATAKLRTLIASESDPPPLSLP
jgi:hypothetical protein